MKKHLILISNILVIFIGILGLGTPYITGFFTSVNLGAILDASLLQPLYFVFLAMAVYGQVKKIKDTLTFMPLILELVFGITGFFYIFPFQNLIVGYICLAGIIFVTFWPAVRKFLRRKKIVTIKV